MPDSVNYPYSDQLVGKPGDDMMKLRLIGNIITVILVLLWVLIYADFLSRYRLKHRTLFKDKYCRELPGDYTPAEMGCLISKGSVSPRDIIATLLDLTRKKHLLLTTVDQPADGLFKYKDTLGFIFQKNSETPDIPLKEHESFLIDWFITQIGDGCSFSLDQVNEHISDGRYFEQFKLNFVRWRSLAEEEAGKDGFFLPKENHNTLSMIYCGLGIYYFVMGMFAVMLFGAPYGALNCGLGLILVFSALFTKLTVHGYEQRAKWLAFKRFITDFSQLENADIRSVGILERYLVYAVSLGAAKNVITKMPLLINYSTYDSSHLTFTSGCPNYSEYLKFADNLGEAIDFTEGSLKSAGLTAKHRRSRAGSGKSGADDEEHSEELAKSDESKL